MSDKDVVERVDELAALERQLEAAYIAAIKKREKEYQEQVEFDVKAALNVLNCNSSQMPYYIYSMLFDQISAIGYTPNCGADMRGEANDE